MAYPLIAQVRPRNVESVTFAKSPKIWSILEIALAQFVGKRTKK